MYKKNRHRQFCLADFNQPIGLKVNPDNRWVIKSEMIPWDEIEDLHDAIRKISDHVLRKNEQLHKEVKTVMGGNIYYRTINERHACSRTSFPG